MIHDIDINKQSDIDPSKIFELIVCFVIEIWFLKGLPQHE